MQASVAASAPSSCSPTTQPGRQPQRTAVQQLTGVAVHALQPTFNARERIVLWQLRLDMRLDGRCGDAALWATVQRNFGMARAIDYLGDPDRARGQGYVGDLNAQVRYEPAAFRAFIVQAERLCDKWIEEGRA